MLSVQEYVFVFVFYLTIGMVLYSCSLELIYLALLELYAHWLATLHSYPSPAPGDTILLFESMNLLLSSSYKWKHALFVLLWLIYFTWHNIHLCSWSVFADYRISFFLKADIQLYIYIYIHIYTAFSLSSHLLKETSFLHPSYCEESCSKCGNANIFLKS